MPKILISDSLAEQGVTVLEEATGIEVVNKPGLSPEELLAAIPEFDGLVIRSNTKVTEEGPISNNETTNRTKRLHGTESNIR